MDATHENKKRMSEKISTIILRVNTTYIPY